MQENFVICKTKKWTERINLTVHLLFGDPDGNRTRVTAVKGRCLNRLTTGPYLVAVVGLEPTTLRVWTECSSQLSYTAIFCRWIISLFIIQRQKYFVKHFFKKSDNFFENAGLLEKKLFCRLYYLTYKHEFNRNQKFRAGLLRRTPLPRRVLTFWLNF